MFRPQKCRHDEGCIQKDINTTRSLQEVQEYIFNTIGCISIYLYISSLMTNGTGRNMWKRHYKWQIIAYCWFGLLHYMLWICQSVLNFEINNGLRFFYFVQWTNKCTIILQIFALLHVSTLLCHPQAACNQYLAKSLKYVKFSCWEYNL